ncbi:DUF1850 domain-containing protein [Palleronia sp. KMU-117]|uniref:DUF1850 domain-containing protein n=1 Tax=Palleronia sp. KMU-117 TaxID=3434108 RepID=UPI003D713738
MIARLGGGLGVLLLSTLTAAAGTLVAAREDGAVILRAAVPEGAEWCVLWRHSVKGFEVADCYENRAGRMVLVRAHLPDFAAGLDHIPGRGRQVSDGAGGYWILDIDEPVPGDAYVLRPGTMAVDHRIRVGPRVVSLSAVAEHERVRIALLPEDDG